METDIPLRISVLGLLRLSILVGGKGPPGSETSKALLSLSWIGVDEKAKKAKGGLGG